MSRSARWSVKRGVEERELYRPPVAEPDWYSWVRRMLVAGDAPEECIALLVEKGFEPLKAERFVQRVDDELQRELETSRRAEPDDSETPTRPLAISVVCVLGFIGAAIALLLLPFVASRLGSEFAIFLIAASAANAVCFYGMWNMRKWGIILYTALTTLTLVASLFLETSSMLSLGPLVVIVFGFTHFDKMR